MTKLSIRQRLLLWLLSALLLAGMLAGIATYFKAREEVSELFDYQLRQITLSLLKGQPVAVPALRVDGEAAGEDSDFVGQIRDRRGRLVYSSQPSIRLPMQTLPGLSTISFNQEQWRVFVLKNTRLMAQAGQRVSEQEELAADMALRLLIPQLTLIPVLALLIWIGVGRGLLPLKRLVSALNSRSPAAMEPLPSVEAPGEIKPLIAALNDLLLRLSGALATQRQFIEDAAHELRTPLTAVKLQAQLLERAETSDESQQAALRLKQGIERATHLTQQLLTLARIEPDATQHRFSTVDLEQLLKSVLLHLAPQAHEKSIDLGLTLSETAYICGDAESLRIVLENVLDNALRYSPAGGRVDVSLFRLANDAILEITDTGCGIPVEEHGRVFDRFYRCSGTQVAGSGLGLAIVKSIVDRHHGKVLLTAGPNQAGLKISLVFSLEANT